MKNRIFRAMLLIAIIWATITLVSIQSCDSGTYPITGYKTQMVEQSQFCNIIYDALTQIDVTR